MFKIPKDYRNSEKDGFLGYSIPFNNQTLKVLASIDVDDKGIEWEHVSVSLKNRCPTWDEMKFIKMKFWDDEDEVLQFFPKKSEYVNAHKYCLHMWRPRNLKLPWE